MTMPPTPEALAATLRRLIRDVPDFPRPGIVFKDITPVLHDATAFAATTRALAARFATDGISHVLAVESRGFLFGAPVAQHLGAALVPVRKPGKLPRTTVSETYALEYGTDALELHSDALGAADRVVVIDDVLATGGTAAATSRLAERLGATVVGLGVVIDLSFLPWREALKGRRVETLVAF